jgi:hypothetical protein
MAIIHAPHALEGLGPSPKPIPLVAKPQPLTPLYHVQTIMGDRPDLIVSELAGLAFDAQQSIFRPVDIDTMFSQEPYKSVIGEDIFIVIDPAAGGPNSDYAFVSFTRLRGSVRIVGGEILSGCKDPAKQFDLVEDHIRRLRIQCAQWNKSRIVIYVERNLGHEAEHHKYALKHLPGVYFREDAKESRVGVLTTASVKMGMATGLNIMLREQRVCCLPEKEFVCKQPREFVIRLRDQMNVYALQFKDGTDVFCKQRMVLSGKIGGMKDDIIICLQLGIFFTDWDAQHGLKLFGEGGDLRSWQGETTGVLG